MALTYTLVTLPTVLLGYIQGPIRRESRSGEINWGLPGSEWLVNDRPKQVIGQTFAITHIQKLSKFGFLVTWPFCIHVYFTFKEQQMDAEDTWIPGSETVLYFRTPGYRRDTATGMKWTWGYFGLNWD